MPMPSGIAIIDTMLELPPAARDGGVAEFGGLFRDHESRTGAMGHPAGYMYKDAPTTVRGADPVAETIAEMDRFGIEKALIRVNDAQAVEAVTRHPDRFLGQLYLDPHRGMDMVRDLVRAKDRFGIVAASLFPAGQDPPVPINDKIAYPLYAKCVELDIPIFINAGVPGPRIPYASQHVGLVDEVCWFFPELKIVLRHGCEPWTDLAIKLLLRWPNLYYSTSAFAPKYYPRDIIDFANTRGADKILYAGYYPAGLTLDRIFEEMPQVPFRDHVWPKFLRENALRILGLPA